MTLMTADWSTYMMAHMAVGMFNIKSVGDTVGKTSWRCCLFGMPFSPVQKMNKSWLAWVAMYTS